MNREAIAKINPGCVMLDGLDDAIMGMTVEQKPRLIYDYAKCCAVFQSRDGMTEDDAMEWVDFNVLGVCVGPEMPVVVRACTDNA